MTNPALAGNLINGVQQTGLSAPQNVMGTFSAGTIGGPPVAPQPFQQAVAPMSIVNGASLMGMGAASDGWNGDGGSFIGRNVTAGLKPGTVSSPTQDAMFISGLTPAQKNLIPEGAYNLQTGPNGGIGFNVQNWANNNVTSKQAPLVQGTSADLPPVYVPLPVNMSSSYTAQDLANNAINVAHQNTINAQNTLNQSIQNMRAGPINGLAASGISPWMFPTVSPTGQILPNYTGIDTNGNPINPTTNYNVLVGATPAKSILTTPQLNDIWTQEHGSNTPLIAPSYFNPMGYEALNYLQTGKVQSPVQNPAITQLGKSGLNITTPQLNDIWTQEKGSSTPLNAPQGWTPLTSDVMNYLATGFVNQSAQRAMTAPVSNMGEFFGASSASIQKAINTPQVTMPSVNVPNMNNLMPVNIPQISNQNMNMSGIQGTSPTNMRTMLGLDQTWW